MAKTDTIQDAPLTLGGVTKIAASLLTAATVFIGGIWWASSLSQRVDMHDQQIKELRDKSSSLEDRINEIDRKLSEAVVILRRIDERVGKP